MVTSGPYLRYEAVIVASGAAPMVPIVLSNRAGDDACHLGPMLLAEIVRHRIQRRKVVARIVVETCRVTAGQIQMRVVDALVDQADQDILSGRIDPGAFEVGGRQTADMQVPVFGAFQKRA